MFKKNFKFKLLVLLTITSCNFSIANQEESEDVIAEDAQAELNDLFDDFEPNKTIDEKIEDKYEPPAAVKKLGFWLVVRFCAVRNCTYKILKNFKDKVVQLCSCCP